MVKSGGAQAGYDAMVVSEELITGHITGGLDGISAAASQTNKHVRFGLVEKGWSSVTDLRQYCYFMMIAPNGDVKVFGPGDQYLAQIGGSGQYKNGDVFTVRVGSDHRVRVTQNGGTIYTFPSAAKLPLRAAATFYEIGSGIDAVSKTWTGAAR